MDVDVLNVDGFPAFFPSDLKEKALADGAGNNIFEKVYRISKSGKIDISAFLSSYEDKDCVNRDEEKAKESGCYDLSDYSTSFFQGYSDAKNAFKCLKRYNDHPKLIIGSILDTWGLSMLTRNSLSKRRSSRTHIDLWKYESADPSPLFEYYVEEE